MGNVLCQDIQNANTIMHAIRQRAKRVLVTPIQHDCAKATADSGRLRARKPSFAVKFANLAILESLRLRQLSRKPFIGSAERRVSHEMDMNRLEEQYYDLIADYHYFRDVSCALNRLRNRVRTE